MRFEIQHFLEHISEDRLIEEFIKRQTSKGLEELFNHLSFSKPDVEIRWVNIYQNMEQKAFKSAKALKETTLSV